MVNRSHESRKLTYRFELPGGQSRLREMVLYVSEHSADAEFFGLVKLNKILWKADFSAFADRRMPVTGRPYQRLALGPAPVEMRPLLAEMLQDGQIELKSFVFGKDQLGKDIIESRPLAKVTPILRLFSDDDLSYVDISIAYYRPFTGRETSDDSHGIAWSSRNDLDPMPYESALFSDEQPKDSQLNKLATVGRELGWKSL
jgi:Protein of unknown function (DUF4065)